MCSLILFSPYTNDLSKYNSWVIKKHASREALSLLRKMSFTKKNFIYNKKSGANTKIKLVTKYWEAQSVLLRNFVISIMLLLWKQRMKYRLLLNTGFQESNKMVVKKSQSNDKTLRKVISFSFYIEQKNIHWTNLYQ